MAQKKTVRVTEDECRAALKDATQEKSMTVRDVAYVIGLARQASLEKEQLPKPDEKEVATVLLSMAEAGCDGVMCAKRGGVDYFFLLVPQSPSGPSGNSECGDGGSSESSSVRVKKTRKRREKKMEDQNQGQEAPVQGGGALPSGKKPERRVSVVGMVCIVIGVIVGSAGVYAAMNLRSANAAETNEKKSEEAKTEEVKKADPETVTVKDFSDLQKKVSGIESQVGAHATQIAGLEAGLRALDQALGKDENGKFTVLVDENGRTWKDAFRELEEKLATKPGSGVTPGAVPVPGVADAEGEVDMPEPPASMLATFRPGGSIQLASAQAQPTQQVASASVPASQRYTVLASDPAQGWMAVRDTVTNRDFLLHQQESQAEPTIYTSYYNSSYQQPVYYQYCCRGKRRWWRKCCRRGW